MKLGFSTIKVSPPGWLAIVAAGAVLGYGIAKLAHLPIGSGAVVGVVVLWAVLKLLDRRAWSRSLVVVRLDRSRNDLHELVEGLRAKGLPVAINDEPKGIACRGRNHRKVLAEVTATLDGGSRRKPA